MAFGSKRSLDVESLKDAADLIMDWARYQNVGGELDPVESSSVQGTYDWKAYLHEETRLAQERDPVRRPRRGSTDPATPSPLYG